MTVRMWTIKFVNIFNYQLKC